MRTVFLRAGRSIQIHRHDDEAAWLHVVAGEIVDERWTRDREGGFVHERRHLRHGQSMAAPGGVAHSVQAVDDAAFVTTSHCDCRSAEPVPPHDVDAMLRLSRSGEDRDWAETTALGEPSPRG